MQLGDLLGGVFNTFKSRLGLGRKNLKGKRQRIFFNRSMIFMGVTSKKYILNYYSTDVKNRQEVLRKKEQKKKPVN